MSVKDEFQKSASNLNPETSLMTPEEVAQEFSVATRTVLKWVRQGKLVCIRRSQKVIRFNREYIYSLARHPIPDIESRLTPERVKTRGNYAHQINKKGDPNTSGKSSWRSLREEVTKCQ